MNKGNNCCEKCLDYEGGTDGSGAGFNIDICTNAACKCHTQKASNPQKEGSFVAVEGSPPFLNVKEVEPDGSLIVDPDEMKKYAKALLSTDRKNLIEKVEAKLKQKAMDENMRARDGYDVFCEVRADILTLLKEE